MKVCIYEYIHKNLLNYISVRDTLIIWTLRYSQIENIRSLNMVFKYSNIILFKFTCL